MENASALSARRDMFLDERGTGLRVTWHPERDLVVLSVWQDDRCVGTFRMSVQDVPRLSGLLAAALGDWVEAGAATAPEGPGADALDAVRGGGAGGLGLGGPGVGRHLGERDPGVGWRPGGRWVGGNERRAGTLGVGRGPGTGGIRLSMEQRIRLSRAVLKLRGMRHRRRRAA